MSVSFKFCGSLKKLAEKDNFKPLEVKTLGGGWTLKTLKFQGINGTNKHFLQVKAGYWSKENGEVDEEKTVIYSVSSAKDGEKGEKMDIDYADRNDPDVIKKVANFKKFVLDLNKPGEAKDESKRHEFVFEGDFIECLNRLLNKEGIENKKFTILGNVELQYAEKTDKFYRTFSVQRVYLANDDEPEKMEMSGSFVYNSDSWDEENYEETGRVSFNCWAEYYDPAYRKDSCKGVAFAPFSFVFVPEELKNEKVSDPDKILSVYRKRMSIVPDGSEYGTINMTLDVIDGAQLLNVTIDDLSEDAREDIELGLSDLETELRKLGGNKAYGERVTESHIKSCRDAKSADYCDEDMCHPIHDAVEAPRANTAGKVAAASQANSDDDDDDLFDI